MAKKPVLYQDGINLKPEASPTLSTQGTLKYDSVSDKLKLKGSSTTDSVVEEAKTATLTNKTLTTPVINEINTTTNTDLNLNPNGTGKVITDNLALSGNTISTTDTNGNLNLSPDGIGKVTIDNLALSANTLESTSGNLNIVPFSGSAVIIDTDVTIQGGDVDINGQLDVDNLKLNGNTISTTDLNGDINLNPNGTGKVKVQSGAGKGLDVQFVGDLEIGSSVGANDLTLGGSTSTVVIPGNLQIDGTTTNVNTADLNVEDKNITVNNGGNDASSEGAGLTVDRTGTSGSFIYKVASATKFALGDESAEVDVVGISSTQALTGKTLSRASNTFSSFTAHNAITADSSGNLSNGVVPGTAGNVLTSDGLDWVSATPSTSPDQSYEISNLSIACSVAANALTIAIKDKSGSDPSGGSPVKIGFRNATLATGTYNQRSITAALSMVISSGSTLGHSSGNNHYIYVYLLDNSGTVELIASSVLFDEGTIQTTTAEGGAGAADSNSLLYSTTARANVPIRLVGRLNSNQATAGTWTSVPTEISLNPFKKQKVSIKYINTAGTSLNTAASTQIIPFATKVFDTHNTFVTDTFTSPITDNFLICSNLIRTNTTAARMFLYIYKNGIYDTATSAIVSGASAGLNLSTIISLNSGDTITIKSAHDGGGVDSLSTVSGDNTLSITQL